MPPASKASGGPPAALQAFADRTLGGGLSFQHRGWDLKVSNVWRVVTPEGGTYYLKQHEEERLHRQDVSASTEWVPRVPPVAPRLVACDETLLAALFTEVPGRVMSGLRLAPAQQREAYWEGGRFAAVLHGLPLDDDRPDFAAYSVERMRRVCQAARGLVDDAMLRWALDAYGDGEAFAGVLPVPCHRDYSPRNWLLDFTSGQMRWGVIDFERAYPDVWLQDVQRMWSDEWRARPDLQEVFFEGYGRGPDDAEMHMLRLVTLRVAIGTIAWARQYGDTQFEAFGWEVLEWLRREFV